MINKKGYDRIMKLFKQWPILAKLTALQMKMPGAEQLSRPMKWPASKIVDLNYIPVNADIEADPGVVLPYEIIEHFIDKACYHVVMNECPCRSVANCHVTTKDFGCLFMGKGAKEISPELSRRVDKEEAKQHLHEAMEYKLMPTMGRFIFDAALLGIRDHMHLMTVCFCCPCCCIGNITPTFPEWTHDLYHSIEGVRMEITDDCTGCGKCIDVCLSKQIAIVDGKKVIGEHCKVCGMCANVCPQGAMKVVIEDKGYYDRVVKRLTDYVDVT